MAPRRGSPTRAFDPTPALEKNTHNYSPLNHQSDMLSFDSYATGLPKEVRFSEQSSGNFHRAHSIATDNVPLLPAVSSASTVPKTSFRITNPTPGIDITAYIENCRNLNEQLRQAHEAERKAWNIERSALKARIADLEFRLNKTQDSTRRSSIESQSSNNHHTVRSDIRSMYQSNKLGLQKTTSDSISPKFAPVWQGPESTPPTTRVFQTEETNGHHLPSISEDEPMLSLSREISPSSAIENNPVPIEKVDSTLDGITLRSAALTSSFVTKITSPQFGSPSHTPSPKPDETKTKDGILHIDASALLSPLDEKLKRHAGHTPMAFGGPDFSNGASEQPTELATPVAEKPPAPAPTTRPPLRPSERSDSYFSTVSDEDIKQTVNGVADQEEPTEYEGEPQPQFETEDDKPLKGPLMLDPTARSKAASAFLEKLDAKLEAVREASPERRDSVISDTANKPVVPLPDPHRTAEEAKGPEPDDDMPKLRMRKSTNFGSAYGFNMPGRF